MSRLSIGGALDAHAGRVPDRTSLAVVSRAAASRQPPRSRRRRPRVGVRIPVPDDSRAPPASSIVVAIVVANDTLFFFGAVSSPSRVDRRALDARDNDRPTTPRSSRALSERVIARADVDDVDTDDDIFPIASPPVVTASRLSRASVGRSSSSSSSSPRLAFGAVVDVDRQHVDHIERPRPSGRGAENSKTTRDVASSRAPTPRSRRRPTTRRAVVHGDVHVDARARWRDSRRVLTRQRPRLDVRFFPFFPFFPHFAPTRRRANDGAGRPEARARGRGRRGG